MEIEDSELLLLFFYLVGWVVGWFGLVLTLLFFWFAWSNIIWPLLSAIKNALSTTGFKYQTKS